MQIKAIISCFLFLFLLNGAKAQDTSFNQLSPVIVSANRLTEMRKQAPIAISIITQKTIEETKAQRIDFLLNKVSGVYMPTIGNEQHMMAIRQPISLKGLYLFLEDGMPIRTSGLFSNNALIEINNSNIHSIEIIKGPASALYGAEAIGGAVNFITHPVASKSFLDVSTQVNQIGFKKIDLTTGIPNKKGAWYLNANFTHQQNGVTEYSDFNKKALSIKKTFVANKKLKGYQTLNYIDYYTQMTGSLDSIKFFQQIFGTQQTFTYRKLKALRLRQNIQYDWNLHSTTTLNVMFRHNVMDQNPTYAIASTMNPTRFKGQVNQNQFDAYVIDIQHDWNIPSLKSRLLIGGYGDFTPQKFMAHYIDIFKDTNIGKYTKFSYPSKDSLISSYHTQLNNKAIYANFIVNISNTIRLNASLRYDDFKYLFNNDLLTGTPSSNNHFTNWSPKFGFTFNKKAWGSYFNYSQGFVPPQITEIYNAIRVPFLLPQQFDNTEIGSWFQSKKMYFEVSLYQLMGSNEIISVRQSDGVNLNQNSGATKHIGIEYQLRYQMHANWELSINGTQTKHQYINTLIKGTDVSGNEMNAAPHAFNNINLIWKPISTLRISIERQKQSQYFLDEINANTYPGFEIWNARFGYTFKKSEAWIHVLNLSNAYYATMATKNFSVKGSSAYSYYIGDARSITIGWKWHILK